MFLSAPAFNQNLAAWNLASVSSMLILHGEPERFFPFRGVSKLSWLLKTI
jgi:hypothetical protein